MFPKVFRGMGKLKPPYHMEIEFNSRYVINATRQIPVTLREGVKKELDEMEKAGIIVKVERPKERPTHLFWALRVLQPRGGCSLSM